MEEHGNRRQHSVPSNKGKLIGQKAPLKLKEIWAIWIRLQLAHRARDLALFNLGIDSKLRGCDLVALRVCDLAQAGRVASRAIVMQRKTHRPVQFELTEQTREAVQAWITQAKLTGDQFLFPSRLHASRAFVHASVRPDSRLLGFLYRVES
jgi:integrase